MMRMFTLEESFAAMSQCFDTIWMSNAELPVVLQEIDAVNHWNFVQNGPLHRLIAGKNSLMLVVTAEKWQEAQIYVSWSGFARMKLSMAEPDEFSDWEVRLVEVVSGLYRPLERHFKHRTSTQLVAISGLSMPVPFVKGHW